jgi:ABC-type lipoprotein release transport system permease subunit
MGLELQLAWRNVWRNRRRTGLTVAATVFAVVLVVFFVAMAAGLHEKMIEDAVRLHSGHVAISAHGYRETRTLEKFVPWTASLRARLDRTPGIEGWAPRVVGFGLLSKDSGAKGVVVLGVDPTREPGVSTLAERVARGRFVTAESGRSIVLGGRLAESLDVELGDELLLYSVAYTLESAYELFEVVGTLHLPEVSLDRSLSVISLTDAQQFFGYAGRVSEIAVLARSADDAPEVAASLRSRLQELAGGALDVDTWSELMPVLAQLVLLDDGGMFLLLVILVVVVGFGILNTILMAVLERKRELGVMLALGLRPGAVFRVVYLESMLLASLGLGIGLALGIGLVLYFQGHPVAVSGPAAEAMELFGIEPLYVWKLKPGNPIGSVLTILGVASLAALYPAWKASRSRPVDVLRSL